MDGTRHPYWRKKPNGEALAALFHSCPGIDHNIASCNMVSYVTCPFLMWFLCVNGHHLQILLPHALCGEFILFTIDKHVRRVSILDPSFEPLSDERYQLKLQRCSFYLNEALGIAQPS